MGNSLNFISRINDQKHYLNEEFNLETTIFGYSDWKRIHKIRPRSIIAGQLSLIWFAETTIGLVKLDKPFSFVTRKAILRTRATLARFDPPPGSDVTRHLNAWLAKKCIEVPKSKQVGRVKNILWRSFVSGSSRDLQDGRSGKRQGDRWLRVAAASSRRFKVLTRS